MRTNYYVCFSCMKLLSLIKKEDLGMSKKDPWPNTMSCPDCGSEALKGRVARRKYSLVPGDGWGHVFRKLDQQRKTAIPLKTFEQKRTRETRFTLIKDGKAKKIDLRRIPGVYFPGAKLIAWKPKDWGSGIADELFLKGNELLIVQRLEPGSLRADYFSDAKIVDQEAYARVTAG